MIGTRRQVTQLSVIYLLHNKMDEYLMFYSLQNKKSPSIKDILQVKC